MKWLPVFLLLTFPALADVPIVGPLLIQHNLSEIAAEGPTAQAVARSNIGVSGSGSFSTPPPIGDVTPNTGAFTVLNVTGPMGYLQNGNTILNVFGSGNGSGANTCGGYLACANLPAGDLETTAYGYRALWQMTGTTAENTAIGWQSQEIETTAFFNTSLGVNTLGQNLTSSDVTAIGTDVMRDGTSVGNSVGVGAAAMRDWNCQFCIAIGVQALSGQVGGASTGSSNIAIGFQSLEGLTSTTSQLNVAVGDNTAPGITTGSFNVLLGHSAGQAGTTLAKNVFVGSFAGNASSTNSQDVFVGYQAGLLSTNSNNTLLGYSSGIAITTANSNTCLGSLACSTLVAGSSNLILGAAVASTTLTGGGHNIILGVSSNADLPANTNDSLLIQGNGTTAAITGTGLNGSAPAIGIPGTLQIGTVTILLDASELGMAKITPSGSAPGAGAMKFAVVAGTSGGTCKLVAYAGTSSTPTTIIDNVGSGC